MDFSDEVKESLNDPARFPKDVIHIKYCINELLSKVDPDDLSAADPHVGFEIRAFVDMLENIIERSKSK